MTYFSDGIRWKLGSVNTRLGSLSERDVELKMLPGVSWRHTGSKFDFHFLLHVFVDFY